MCVGRDMGELWTEEVCETEIDQSEREIVCKCNRVRAQWVTVWTNRARVPGPQIKWLVRTENAEKVHYEVALKFTVMFSVVVVIVHLWIVLLAFYLDRRDKMGVKA
jgi:hypothetical protein